MRNRTVSSYLERLNRVLVHIQRHLDEPLTIDRLAEVACLILEIEYQIALC